MYEAAVEQTGAPPPEALIAEILLSQLAPRVVHLAATLKLPSHLAQGPKTAEELAPMTATHASSALPRNANPCRSGFFRGKTRSIGSPSVRLARLSSLGRPATQPHSFWEEKSQRAPSISSCIPSRPATAASSGSFGMSLFDWLTANPAQASLFNDMMVGLHGTGAPRNRRGLRLLGLSDSRMWVGPQGTCWLQSYPGIRDFAASCSTFRTWSAMRRRSSSNGASAIVCG